MSARTTEQRTATSRWRWSAAVFATIAAAVFVLNAIVAEIRPGSVWGLTYGTTAALLLLASGAYGIRRRTVALASRQRLGRASTWLSLHLFAGLFFVLLVLLHSGFRLPTGALTWTLWSLSIWTGISGLVGFGLQQWLPTALSSLSTEALYDRIPELCEQLRERAETTAAASREPLPRLYEQRLAATFERPRRRLRFLFDVTGGIRARLQELQYVRRFLEPAEQERLDELQQLYQAKTELDAHYTLQTVLRGWLYLHMPLSLVLVVLVAVHIGVVLAY